MMGEHGNIISFRLRMHEQVRRRDGATFVKTEYVTVKAFGAAADYIGMNVNDGTGVLIQGQIRTERWGGQENRKKETLVVADKIQATAASEEEELREMGASQEAASAGVGAGREGSRTEPGEHDGRAESAPSVEHAAGSNEPAGHRGSAQESAPGAATSASGGAAAHVELPVAGTPEFEKLKGIQGVPW